MERSFYGNEVNPFANNAEEELNKVQMLPESDDELVNGNSREEEKENRGILGNGDAQVPEHNDFVEHELSTEGQSSITQVVQEIASELTSALNQNDFQEPPQHQVFGSNDQFKENVNLIQNFEQEHVIDPVNTNFNPFEAQENNSVNFQQFHEQPKQQDILQFETKTNETNLFEANPSVDLMSAEPIQEQKVSETIQTTLFETHSAPYYEPQADSTTLDQFLAQPLPSEPTPVEIPAPIEEAPLAPEPVAFEPTPLEPATVEERVVPPVEIAAVTAAAATVAAAAIVTAATKKSTTAKPGAKPLDAKKAPTTTAAKKPAVPAARSMLKPSTTATTRAPSKSPIKSTAATKTTATSAARPAARTMTSTTTTRKPLTNGTSTTTVKKTTTVSAPKPGTTSRTTTSTTTTRTTSSSVAPRTSTTAPRVPLSAR